MMIKVKLKNIPSGVGANLVFALSPALEVIYRANTRFAPTITFIYHVGLLKKSISVGKLRK